MLGLSLAIRVGKRVLGGLIDSLMSAVKGRATYSENIADSKQVLKDIDSYELLDKASILLTPTAYSDARVHSVKTYTGDELITNGGFDTDSDWTKGTGWTIANGKASNDGSSGSNNLTQGGVLVVGKNYKITITVSDYVSGNVEVSAGASPRGTMSANGTYTFYQTCTPATSFYIIANAFEGSMDNVSVTEADADFDFDRASSATRINSDGLVQDMQSITDPELVLNGDFEELGDDLVTNGDFATDSDWTKSSQSIITNGTARILSTDGSFQYLKQSGYTSTQGKTVKITIDIVDVQNGQLKVFFEGGSNTQNIPSTVGTYTVYLVNDGTVGTVVISRVSGITDITIDNVSVQQVDPNDRWTAQNGWTLQDGLASFGGTVSSYRKLFQENFLTIGNTYELSFEILSISSGSIANLETGSPSFDTVGVKTQTFVATFDDLYLEPTTDANLTIDNISVKDITFSEDVDLARINYDSNGENGHWLLEPTSTNLVTYSEDFTDSSWAKTNCTINSNNSISPEGTQNADKLDFTTSNGEIVRTTSFVSGQEYTMSFYAKTESGTLDFNYGNMDYTMNSGTATTEWQRFEITQTLPSATRFPKIQTTEIGSLLLWGFQIEQLSYATSYIPTYGSTVTRATETLTGSGNSTLINSTEGVLYAEIAALADDGLSKRITISDGTLTNRIALTLGDNNISGFINVNNASQYTFFESITTTDFNKIAIKYKANDFALWINGVEYDVDTSGSTFSANTLNVINFANATNTSNQFYGNCKALAVFDALTDDELELLTGITNYGSFSELAQANGYTII